VAVFTRLFLLFTYKAVIKCVYQPPRLVAGLWINGYHRIYLMKPLSHTLTTDTPIASYKPGLHLIAEFTVHETSLLEGSKAFRQLMDETIARLQLTKVGEVYHDFEGAGYTAVICLTESHISVHTWPEFGMVTFDVFLSNFMRDNEAKVHRIYGEAEAFFKPVSIHKTALNR